MEDGNEENVDNNADQYEESATNTEDEVRFVLIN